MSTAFPRFSPRPCAKVFFAVFGGLFLIALLAVPVTTRTSEVRQDRDSNIVFKTTYPRRATMFLPRYLAAKADAQERAAVRLRSAQWFTTMAVVVLLGVFDGLLVCRVLRRPGRAPEGPDHGRDSPASGLSLFP